LAAVSVEFSCGVPEMVGVALFTGAAWLAACPSPGTPKTAPIASAAAAMPKAASHRGPRELIRVMS
jgi:hypothetical protein